MALQDHFSNTSGQYRQFRPNYPEVLFDWLHANQPATIPRVWDVGCGSGQASQAMASRGWQVIASDLSVTQLEQAQPHPSVSYIAATGEQCPLKNQSVNLVTVAQATHWFDLPTFYAEAERVLSPGGLLTLWGYERPTLKSSPLAEAFFNFHAHWLQPWWPAERQRVDNGYRDLSFPYSRLSTPALSIERLWTLTELLGYAASWSATQRCQQSGGQPIEELSRVLTPHWPSDDNGKPARVAVHWPMFILATKMPT